MEVIKFDSFNFRKRHKRKPLLQSEVEMAIQNTKSNMAAARFLGVSLNTYKKYAEQYFDKDGNNLYDKHKNQSNIGIKKCRLDYHYKGYTLEKILNNEVPSYPLHKVKKRLLNWGVLVEKCSLCGFEEKRLLDGQCPLILVQKDGNKNNYHLDNLELLCYNCYYLTIGDIKSWNIKKQM